MSRKIKISSGTWQKDLEMTITVVDEEKFVSECEKINDFWSGSSARASTHGSNANAGLALFAAECFQQMAFNSFKTKQWLIEQFDWSKKGHGIEGFPSISELGIEINDIDFWFIDSDEIEIS